MKLVLASVVVVVSAACPPFDTLPFPAEGEGEGEGEGPCVPTTQLDGWFRMDASLADDGPVTALGLEPLSDTLVGGTANAEMFTFAPGDARPTSLGKCDLGEEFIPHRIFPLSDGALVASGKDGVCIVDGGTLTGSRIGDLGTEATAAPYDGDANHLVVASIVDSTGTAKVSFDLATRSGGAVTLGANLGIRPLPTGAGTVMAVTPLDGGGALFADEDGLLYAVDAGGLFSAAGDLQGTAPNSVALTAHGSDVEIARMTFNSIELGRAPASVLVTNAASASSLSLLTRDPAVFALATDFVTTIAVRGRDGTRIDAGHLGYASFVGPGCTNAVPLGVSVRVADLIAFAASENGVVWGVTRSGTIVVWDADVVADDRVATEISARGVTLISTPAVLALIDDDTALIGGATGFVVAKRTGSDIAVTPGAATLHVSGFSAAADASVVIFSNGSAASFDPNAPASTHVLTGNLGTAETDSQFDVVAVADHSGDVGDARSILAAGNISGSANLIHCTANVSQHTLACDAFVDLGMAPCTQFSAVANTSGGAFVVADGGVAFVPNPGDPPVVVDTTAVVGAWPDGVGQVIDTNDGCLLITAENDQTFGLDPTNDVPASLFTVVAGSAPFLTLAVPRGAGHLLVTGGQGGTFSDLSYDAGNTNCHQRFAGALTTAIGPLRAQANINAAAFLDDDAYVADDQGGLWRLPAFP